MIDVRETETNMLPAYQYFIPKMKKSLSYVKAKMLSYIYPDLSTCNFQTCRFYIFPIKEQGDLVKKQRKSQKFVKRIMYLIKLHPEYQEKKYINWKTRRKQPELSLPTKLGKLTGLNYLMETHMNVGRCGKL